MKKIRSANLLPMAFCLLTFASIARAELGDDLVSYWPMDSVTVDSTPDVISGNHLFLHNLSSADLAPGRHNQAMALDGKTQFMSINYSQNPKLPISTSKSFTVAMWVKGPAAQKNKIIFAEGFTQDRLPLFVMGTHLTGQSASVNMMIRSRDLKVVPLDNLAAEANVYDNEWHHVAWTDENGAAVLYIDGKIDVTSYNYQRKETRLNYLSIGALLREPPVYFFQGAIDDVAIWNRALAQNEVQDVMSGGLTAVTTKKKAQN
jgi:hypothetical protein